jgi:2-dehydro-3-deoxyphosphogluconate aldolase/(4S)-4-hydroxy-2-oxoglutarate aldolase
MTGRALPRPLTETPIIGIMRRCPLRHAQRMAGAAIEAGLRVIEVTFDSDRPALQISLIRESFPEALVGAGSVRSAEDVDRAIDAGAGFIVSPMVEESVIVASLERNAPSFPGAATPTEIERAMRLGAAAVKVFPANLLGGPEYIRAVSSPLGDPPLIPTGGVTIDSIPEYRRAGVVAVGLGGTLFPRDALEYGDAGRIANLTSMAIEMLA